MLLEPAIQNRADEIVTDHLLIIHQRMDRLFAGLLFIQWLGCIVAALLISPRAWVGAESSHHIHIWAATLLAGAVVSLPILLALYRPGSTITRHVVAISQMLMSALLIHFTGGRIETHFHIFGSLALLAAYRDWRVLLTSTIIVVLDHGLRGMLWPESVFGVVAAAPWRTLEHAGWVVFENVFLIVTIRQSITEMKNIGYQQSMLESSNRRTELTVQERTAELKGAEQRLQLIIDSVPNGVVMIDDTGTICLANPRSVEMFGYAQDELLGQKFEILVPKEIRKQHPILRDTFSKPPQEIPMGSVRDLRGLRHDGSEFPVELGLNPIQTKEGLFVLAAIVDITARKKTEIELKQYAACVAKTNGKLTKIQAELEVKNRELDEFTYVASHDLQEPVRKLVSFSKLLEQDLGDELNEQARRDLEFIVDSAGRMRQLIQDLLALSRTGRAAMRSEPTALNECLADALSALQLCIDETNVNLELTDLPQVIGDSTMLTQLFQNLVGNALKFTTSQHPVVTLTVEEQDDHWTVGVKDNGIGMKPEHAERIFKPFQRLHRRGEYAGTGIGLSICKKTVERHGGRLWVESSPGEGSHFQFTLPKQKENQLCPNKDESPEKELQSC